MWSRLIVVLTTLVFLVPSLASAAGTNYVSGLLGYTVALNSDAGDLEDLEFKDFGTVAVAAGQEYLLGYGRVRFEGELSYRQNEVDTAQFRGVEADADGWVSALALMANVTYAFETGTMVRPYVLLGGGGTWTDLRDVKRQGVKWVDDSRGQFAYQVGGGAEFDLGTRLVLDVSYRYFSTARDSFEDKAEDDFLFRYRTHSVSVGMRYRF